MLMILARTQKQQAAHRPLPASAQRRRRRDPSFPLQWSMPAMAPGTKYWARRQDSVRPLTLNALVLGCPFPISSDRNAASARDGRRGRKAEFRRSQERHQREGRGGGGGGLVMPPTFSQQEAAPPRALHLRLRGSRGRSPRQGSPEQHCSGQVPHVTGWRARKD
jgi:hypothetical protein